MNRLFLLLFSGLFLFHCNAPENRAEYDFLNSSLTKEERVMDLLSHLTLEEKIAQLNYDAPAIERLGIPAYNWWNECLHGVGRAGKATVFPQAIGMAASWNTELMHGIGTVISEEARAKHHALAHLNKRDIYYGLTFWTPNINIFRDPRWGRGQETYGEDPFLTSSMAVPFIRGLQGDDPDYLKVVATAKHYAVHSGPEHSRHSINIDVSNVDLHETYLPAFKATVTDAGVASIMCAYNRFRDEACCGSELLLQAILRDKWGFEGYVVSDCGAISDFYRENAHEIVNTPQEAAALAFRTGTDLNCGGTSHYLAEAVREGLIDEQEIDRSLKRLFEARVRLGMFDLPQEVPYTGIPYRKVRSEQHLEKALLASRESIVLLKNEGILPLKEGLKKIAVIGPLADDYRVLLGNYHGTSDNMITMLEGIREYAHPKDIEVEYSPGCQVTAGVANLNPVPSENLWTPDEITQGLSARYYGNRDFSGEPAIERTDSKIDFWWHDKTPVTGAMADEFSVIWEGYIEAPESDVFEIGVNACNGVRFYFEDSLRIQFDNVHHPLQKSFETTLVEGKKYKLKLEYFNYGNDPQAHLLWGKAMEDRSAEAVAMALKSDQVILCMGLSPYLEGEEMPIHVEGFSGGDRTDISLPATQLELMKKIVATGKPVVLVLMGGSAVAVNYADQHISGILHAWYPGEYGGKAVTEILFGEVNPSGKLPVTFYKSVDDLPDFEDYNMDNRTYKYFTGEPLYPFGHGLSYSKFEYSSLSVTPDPLQEEGSISVSVRVTNTGKMAGYEVGQMYISDIVASEKVPNISLEGFKKLWLEPGQQEEIQFEISPEQLAIINNRGERILEPGSFRVFIGGKQPGMTGSADNPTTQVLEAEFKYVGPFITLEK